MEPPAGPLRGAPYAAALRRCFSNLRRRDVESALAAANEAVALEPGLVEPYRWRAFAWQLLGDYIRSASDRATCMALDPHFANTGAIRHAVHQLRAAYDADPVVDDSPNPHGCAHVGLRAVLERRASETRRRRALLARPSCDLPCPSACCYFEDDTFTYGIFLRREEFDTLRDHLRRNDLEAADFIGSVDSTGGPVHYPLRNGLSSPSHRSDWQPRTLAYSEPMWISSRARPCAFVGPGGCAVHDVGTPPGVAACRAFLCLAAFVWLLLRDTGAARPDDVAGRSMADLHNFSIAALPLLAARFSSTEIASAQREMRCAVTSALEQERAGCAAGVDEALGRYDAACQRSRAAERGAHNVLDHAVRDFSDRRQA
jgi:hypothetical protein